MKLLRNINILLGSIVHVYVIFNDFDTYVFDIVLLL